MKGIIKLLHFSVAAFVVLTPFITCNEALLTYHLLIVGLIMLHWLTNNNVCALTEIERRLRGCQDTHETFIGSIINPIYELNDQMIWIITGGLFLLTALRLRAYKFQYLCSFVRK
jgi:hypothetical protein